MNEQKTQSRKCVMEIRLTSSGYVRAGLMLSSPLDKRPVLVLIIGSWHCWAAENVEARDPLEGVRNKQLKVKVSMGYNPLTR